MKIEYKTLKIFFSKSKELAKMLGHSLAPLAEDAFESLSSFLEVIAQQLTPKDHGLKATFGKPQNLISRKNKGFVVDGKRALSVKKSRNNFLVVAPSGMGKSQCNVFPSLNSIGAGGNSILVNDPHQELVQFIPYLESIGYRSVQLDMGADEFTHFYNPLLRCIDKSSTNKIAQTIMQHGAGNAGKSQSSSGSYFNTRGADAIGMVVNYLRDNQPEDYYNLANVYHLLQHLQASPRAMHFLFTHPTVDDKLSTEFLSLMATSEATRTSIISTAQSALSFIGLDDRLSYFTSKDNIDFSSMRTNMEAWFVQVPISDSLYYQKIVGMFFNDFFSHVFKALPKENDKDIFVVLDEMGALAPTLYNFSDIISSGRKFSIPLMGILQSENQLIDVYGKNQAMTILNNFNTKVYYGGLYDEADRLERFLGKYSYSEKNEKTGHETTKTRSLMTSTEIRNLNGEVLCLSTLHHPLKLKFTPAYKQYHMRQKMAMPSTSIEEKEAPLDAEEQAFADVVDSNSYHVPLLPIPSMEEVGKQNKAQEYEDKRKAFKEGYESNLNN